MELKTKLKDYWLALMVVSHENTEQPYNADGIDLTYPKHSEILSIQQDIR